MEAFPGAAKFVDEGTGKEVFVDPTPRITERDILTVAHVTSGFMDGVELRLTPGAGTKMRQLSREQEGKPIALVVNGRVVSAPIIHGEIADQIHISMHTEDAAMELFQLLSSGKGKRP